MFSYPLHPGPGTSRCSKRLHHAGAIEAEASLTLNKLQATIENSTYRMEYVLKVNCYLASMDNFTNLNRVYAEYFPFSPPARTAIQARRLPAGVRVEIYAIASRNR
ncbi:MAG: RidA family protein [Dehalococcoidales bacterium]